MLLGSLSACWTDSGRECVVAAKLPGSLRMLDEAYLRCARDHRCQLIFDLPHGKQDGQLRSNLWQTKRGRRQTSRRQVKEMFGILSRDGFGPPGLRGSPLPASRDQSLDAWLQSRHLSAFTSGQHKKPQPRESWWGALEVGGSCLNRVATVTAYTD